MKESKATRPAELDTKQNAVKRLGNMTGRDDKTQKKHGNLLNL
jgi:hypothetical protein